jgi:hypothetical protein
MHCPNCHCKVVFELGLFRGTRCKRCNSTILISSAYMRALMMLSLLIAWIFLWVFKVPTLLSPSLGTVFGFLATAGSGFPLAFLILTVLVRTVPHLIPPILVIRHPSTVTTLDLS